VIDDQLLREEMALQNSLESLEDELDKASGAHQEAVRENMLDVKRRLEAVHEQARAAIELKKAETELKVKALRTQAETAAKEAKTRIERRISEAQADSEMRKQKLHQAGSMAREALGPRDDFEEPVTGFRLR
jgi:hypothetical protein